MRFLTLLCVHSCSCFKLDFKKVTPSYECAAHLKKERSFKVEVETRQENFADVEAHFSSSK